MAITIFDIVCFVLFAILGALFGYLVLHQAGSIFFYQNFTPEIVYWACGYSFGHPGDTPAQLLDFLFQKTTKFDCGSLKLDGPLNPPGIFALTQLYLTWSAALLWRFTSIDYLNLWPLLAFLSALYAAGCFVLLRQFFGLFAAFIGAVFLALSPIALPLQFMLRDYSKAPFFIWTVLFLILCIRVSTLRSALVWAGASAVVIGVGYGFRADIILMLPMGAVALMIVWDIRQFLRRAIVTVAFVSFTLLAALPVTLNATIAQGTYGSLILQGMSDPFRAYLKFESAPYSFGGRYLDELTLSSVAADERPFTPDWDAKEPPAIYGVSQSMTQSGKNWLRYFPYFLADFVVQAFKSAAWIIGLPALAIPGAPADPGFPARHGPAISLIFGPVYDLVTKSWMPWLCLTGFFVFFWRLWSWSWKEAISVGAFLGMLLTYPVVQFSIRHVFHLEFVWVCSVLALFHLPLEFKTLRRCAVSYFSTIGSLVAAAFLVYFALVSHQEKGLVHEFTALLSQKRETIVPTTELNSGADVRFNIPVPPAHQQIIQSKVDSMDDKLPERGIEWDVRAEADRLLVTIGGKGCVGEIKVVAVYTKRAGIWQPLDQIFTIRRLSAEGQTKLLLPAFYRPTQNLDAIQVEPTQSGCTVAIERILGGTIFPSLMTAVLQADWERKPLHMGWGRF